VAVKAVDEWVTQGLIESPNQKIIDQSVRLRISRGAKHSRWHLLSHAASMVAVVTSIIGGVFVGLAAHTLAAGRVPVAVGPPSVRS
jgi:hypothetical protein